MYDAIIFAEVMEHLHTSPRLVLQYLTSLLRPGGILIVQTPNAVALPRRVKMLLGWNPFELIRDDASNPGHFREYTADELCNYAVTVGLSVESIECRSYFDYRFARHGATTLFVRGIGNIKNYVYPVLPASLRPGLTAILRRSNLSRQAA